MAESGRGRGKSPFYFSRGQIVLLAFSVVVTSTLVFLLGVLVGQRVEERKLLKVEEPPIKIPVPHLAKGLPEEEQSKREMTFYDTLAKAPSEAKSAAEPGGGKDAGAIKTERPKKKSGEKKKVAEEEKKKTSAVASERVWAVQVHAFAESESAENLVRQLKGKGYDAYLIAANVGGRTWYRVRVGRLATRGEAAQLQKTLQTKENFTKAILVSR